MGLHDAAETVAVFTEVQASEGLEVQHDVTKRAPGGVRLGQPRARGGGVRADHGLELHIEYQPQLPVEAVEQGERGVTG